MFAPLFLIFVHCNVRTHDAIDLFNDDYHDIIPSDHAV